MNQHFVSAFQQVGQFKVSSEYRATSSKDSARLRKQGGNLVSYFCTPDGQILNFVVGAAFPNRVIEAADWALEQRPADDVAGEPLSQAQRQAHLAALPEDFRSAYQKLLTTTKLSSTPSVEQILDLALQTQDKQTGNGLVNLPPGPQFDAFRRKFAIRNIGAALPHVILMHRPLAKLDEVSKPIFESLAGEAFNPYGQRNELLAKTVKQNIENRVPTILVIEPQIDPAASSLLGGQAESPLTNNLTVKRHLASMRKVSLTDDELTWLLADLGQSAIAIKRGTKLQFVLLDARGERVAALSSKTPSRVLARFMAMAIGDTAVR